MADHDHAGTGLGKLADRGREPLDPGKVGDAAVPHRDVQVGTQQDALVGYVPRRRWS